MRKPAPSDLLDALPEPAAALAHRVLTAADGAGFALYVVGGPVRDFLLGRPLHDLDLAVEADSGATAEAVAEAVGLPATRHDRFGTVRVTNEGAALDLATTRRESYAHPGALPTVEPADLEADLRRRDFSVNAMAMPLSRAARTRHGELVDPTGGRRDLASGLLRILHRGSFHDDPTRALRAARLVPRLSFALARDTRPALRAALRDGVFGRVSGDRLRREVVKLFNDAALGLDPARALRQLADWHVLTALEPGLTLPPEAVAPLRRIGRAVADPPWRSTRWQPWVSGLAVWLAGLPAGLRRGALQRLAVRGERAERVAAFPKRRDRWLRELERARGRGAIDALLSPLDEDLLHALFASAPPTLRRRIARFAGEDRGRRAPIGGAELLELGFSGAALGRALARVRAAFLDGRASDREEALALARELLRGRAAGAPRRRRR